MPDDTGGQAALSLKWLYVAWLSLAFTAILFAVFGMIEQGNPTEAIERIFGDVSLFGFGAYLIGLVAASLVLRHLLKRNNLGWRDVGLRGSFTKRAAAYAAIGWFIAFWLYYIVDTTTGFLGLKMFWNEGEFFRLDSVGRAIAIPVGAIIIAPIAEEIIYRGYVLPALMARFGTSGAVILSALIFASVHSGIGPGMMVYIFLGSFIPAYLYLRFRNIYPCIFMHFLNNIVAYLVIPVLVM